MSKPVPIVLSVEQRQALERILKSPTAEARWVFRARLVLACARGQSNPAVAKTLQCMRETVRLWRNRYAARGLEGLKDRPGRGRNPTVRVERASEILAATLKPPPAGITHWSTRRLARQVGVSHTTVHQVWKEHGLQPHRERTFKYSTDPLLVEKTLDIVGLYLNPPDQALVLCADEKTQIQALERTQRLLPMKGGSPARRTHDYRRHGTLSLLAALNQATGEVVAQTTSQHCHPEFLAFLRLIARTYPIGEIHLIVDNYAVHKHWKVKAWLARHSRFVFHFTPTGASWMNLVEGWFGVLSRQRIRRGSFDSVAALREAIEDYIRHWNRNPRPFVWTKTPREVLRPYDIANTITAH